MRNIFTAIAGFILGAGAIAAPGAPDGGEAAYEHVTLQTNMGTIVLELDAQQTPISTENFVQYVKDGFYDGTIFHRVMNNFMIQGGGFDTSGVKKETRAPIKNEFRAAINNDRGTIAMARLGNQPDSGTSQFFINLADNGFLDQPRDGAGYAVFGHLVKGEDVLDAIGNATTSPQGMHGDVPVDPITIETVSKLSEEKALELGLTEAEG